MQGLIVGNLLTNIIEWMYMVVVIHHNSIQFHIKPIGQSLIFPIVHPNSTLVRDKRRPRSSRIRNEMDWREPSVKVRCGLCKQEGHNRQKCPNRGESSNTTAQ